MAADFLPSGKKMSVRVTTIIAVSLLLIIGTALIGIDINKRVVQIQKTVEELTFRRGALAALNDLKSQYERAKTYDSALANILPTRDQLVGLPRELQILAQKHSVATTFKFSDETPSSASEPGSISFQMSASGAFNGIIAFLEEIERSRFFVELGTLDLSRSGDKTTVAISGRVFSR